MTEERIRIKHANTGKGSGFCSIHVKDYDKLTETQHRALAVLCHIIAKQEAEDDKD